MRKPHWAVQMMACRILSGWPTINHLFLNSCPTAAKIMFGTWEFEWPDTVNHWNANASKLTLGNVLLKCYINLWHFDRIINQNISNWKAICMNKKFKKSYLFGDFL